jgi:predicted dienelactone hydrolase
MRNLVRAFALLLALFAAPAATAGVGFQHLTIPDPQGPPIEIGVWYPTDADGKTLGVELFTEALAVDAPVKGARLPLVVMSHGTGGSYAGHIDTAVALAKAGFVAAALTHTGDNWRDQSRAVKIWDRTRQLKLLTDYMLAGWSGRASLAGRRIGAFGFSAGGLTVLAAAGGVPDLDRVTGHCREHRGFECQYVARAVDLRFSDAVWTHDPRIKAVVSAAPALGYTLSGHLAAVRQPVQLWRASDDQVLPHPYYAEAVRVALPKPPEFHLVENAGHYDFLAPCSPALAKANATICVSNPGFDRAAFHADFDREVVGFFRRTLAR